MRNCLILSVFRSSFTSNSFRIRSCLHPELPESGMIFPILAYFCDIFLLSQPECCWERRWPQFSSYWDPTFAVETATCWHSSCCFWKYHLTLQSDVTDDKVYKTGRNVRIFFLTGLNTWRKNHKLRSLITIRTSRSIKRYLLWEHKSDALCIGDGSFWFGQSRSLLSAIGSNSVHFLANWLGKTRFCCTVMINKVRYNYK